ncbi:hypothetical protein VTK56DRAFT_1383 [Thermocarpiscus australiensis]
MAMLKSMLFTKTFTNPVLYEDFPDNDVSMGPDGAFYFSASNFHYSPGAPILRFYDLVNWESVGHSIPRLDFGEGYDLPPSGQRVYRAETWASTLRYRKSNGLWYWIGCTNFWYTWMYTAKSPEGPWTRAAQSDGGVCYYDLGLLIDDDDTLYVAYSYDGDKQVNVTQLSDDGLKPVRTERVLLPGQVGADSLEGNRMYKINGTYYILNDRPGSTAYVWKSSSSWGPYEGKALAESVTSPVPGGGPPHQGSLIQTPAGDWYFMSFTWAYPSRRLPVLAPIHPSPSAGRAPTPSTPTSPPTLPPTFEWNHNADTTKFSLSNNTGLTLSTASITTDLYAARNTLTHRAHGPFPVGTVPLDISAMADGDRAGLAAFRDRSAYIGVHRTGTGTLDLGHVVATAALPRGVETVWFQARLDARASGTREARFGYSFDGARFVELGGAYPMYDGWAFFLGYRFGIFNFATEGLGGGGGRGKVRVLSFTTA